MTEKNSEIIDRLNKLEKFIEERLHCIMKSQATNTDFMHGLFEEIIVRGNFKAKSNKTMKDHKEQNEQI